MKLCIPLRALLVSLPLACVHVPAQESPLVPRSPEAERPSMAVSHELDVEYGFVGGASTHKGRTGYGGISEQNSDIKYVCSPQVTKDLLLRIGFEWERFEFGAPGRALVPETLQHVNAIVGLDYQINEQWLLRSELLPGVYSDFEDISARDFNAPLIIGAAYLVDERLQWFLGLRVDARSQYPVLPAPGVRWKFADDWTAMLLFPKPRLQYDLNQNVQLYAGASIYAGTYVVSDRFGSKRGRRDLNHDTLDYFEVRFGPGVSWKLLPNLTLEIEGGYLAGRRLSFFDEDVTVHSHEAPYAQIACHARF